MRPPNIVYLHSHDTGRYVQPYGQQVPTPNIQRLADQGLLFRQAFCAAPSCSGSRACLLTGQCAHVNGMIGLAHRGWQLADYGRHIVHPLRQAGYWSALIGEQHLSLDPGHPRLRPRGRHRHDHASPRRAGGAAAAAQPACRSRSSCRSGSSRPTASSSSRARSAMRCTARRRLTCPTPPPHAPTWPRSRPAPARWTRASARSSTDSTRPGWPTTRSSS